MARNNPEHIVTGGRDVMSALWHWLCFAALRNSDCTVVIEKGRLVRVSKNGKEIEPTAEALNKDMVLGRCRDGSN